MGNINKNADRMRKRGTQWEKAVGIALDRHKIKHLCQYVCNPFIADFFLYDRGVILEIDGKRHDGQTKKDLMRTKSLEGNTGARVVRWRNVDVTKKLAMLIKALMNEYPVIPYEPPDVWYLYEYWPRRVIPLKAVAQSSG